jgi:hypothetical protein
MDNEKSILEKITDTVKGIATIATDAASHALKTEEPPLKADEMAVTYMPLAADGLVSDPLMMTPVAVAPARKKKRAAKRRVAKKAANKTAKKSAKKSSATKSKKPVKKNVKTTVKKTAKQAARKKKAAKQARKAKRGR